MKNKQLIVYCLAGLFLFLCSTLSFAWDNDMAHPKLAEQSVDLISDMPDYAEIQNYKTYDQINQCGFINEGSVKEDLGATSSCLFPPPLCSLGSSWDEIQWGQDECGVNPYAWKSHGYNPLTRETWYWIPDWPVDAIEHSRNIWNIAETNYSNNKNNAYFHIGRFLHLMADMTSPAHVHADYHGWNDDAEDFGKWYFSQNPTFLDLSPCTPEDNGIVVENEYLAEIENLDINSPDNFVKNLAWRTYFMTSYYGGKLEKEEGDKQPPSELKKMFPSLRYDDGGWLSDSWVIDEIGNNWIGWGFGINPEWWECQHDTGYFYIENINGIGEGIHCSDGAKPAVFKSDNFIFSRITQADVEQGLLDIKLAENTNNQCLASIYAEHLFPLAIEWGAGLLQYFYETVHKPSVTVNDPNGGETWSGIQDISWTATDPAHNGTDALSATIYYCTSATSPGTKIAEGIPCTSGDQKIYSWDTTSVTDGNYWIRVSISDGIGQDGKDVSDASFVINNGIGNTPPNVTVDTPNGGENWSGSKSILWTATDAEQTGSKALSATLYYGHSATRPLDRNCQQYCLYQRHASKLSLEYDFSGGWFLLYCYLGIG